MWRIWGMRFRIHMANCCPLLGHLLGGTFTKVRALWKRLTPGSMGPAQNMLQGADHSAEEIDTQSDNWSMTPGALDEAPAQESVDGHEGAQPPPRPPDPWTAGVGRPPFVRYTQPEGDQAQMDPILCTTCEQRLNGEIQMSDHVMGRKHKRNLRGGIRAG